MVEDYILTTSSHKMEITYCSSKWITQRIIVERNRVPLRKLIIYIYYNEHFFL